MAVPAQPAVVATTVAAPAGTPAPAPSPAPSAGLLPQVTAPVIALARSAEGQHSVTLTVTPENLGPVTVRAHISGGSIRLELHAPSDVGRDALRTILTDLRRDLAVAAPGASLHVAATDPSSASSSQSQARADGQARPDGQPRPDGQAGADAQSQRDAQGRPASDRHGPPTIGDRHEPTSGVPRTGSPLTASSPSSIDVYA
jgi:hypothetical protein